MDGTYEFLQRYSYKEPATHFYYKVHDSSGPLVSDTLYLHKIQTMNGYMLHFLEYLQNLPFTLYHSV